MWINSHGAFIFSIPFWLSVITGEILNINFNSNNALPPKLRLHLFVALALCLPALLISPYGYELPLDMINLLANRHDEFVRELSQSITAYSPTAAFNMPPYYFLDYMIVSMVIYIALLWAQLKQRHVDWVDILTFLAYSWLFVQFGRTTLFLGPVFVFVALDMLSQPSDNADNVQHWKFNFVGITSMIFYLLVVGLVGWRSITWVTCSYISNSLWTGFTEDTDQPIEEATYLEHLPNVHKLGNTYDSGGYLMHRLWPKMLITIDGRYFPFRSWYEQYKMFEDGVMVATFLDNHQADVWLVDHRRQQLMQWFATAANWNPLYIGPVGVVFGPADGRIIKLKEVTDVERITSFTQLQQLFTTAVAMKDWSLAKRLQMQTKAVAQMITSKFLCNEYEVLAQEMQAAIIILPAFFAGDYDAAVAVTDTGGRFVVVTQILVRSFWRVAERAWRANDYAKSRELAFKALNILPTSIISLYNAAIADWQYKKQATGKQLPTSNAITTTWQPLSEIIINNRDKVQAELQPLLDTITRCSSFL